MVGYFKGSAGITITTLLLPDQSPGEREGEKGKKVDVKDKKRECRHSKRELVLVSTLFVSHVRSENPEGWCVTPHLSPLTLCQHLELRYFLITFTCYILPLILRLSPAHVLNRIPSNGCKFEQYL